MCYDYKGSLLKIEHIHDGEELYNFKTIAALEKDKAPFDFDPYPNLNVNAILEK